MTEGYEPKNRRRGKSECMDRGGPGGTRTPGSLDPNLFLRIGFHCNHSITKPRLKIPLPSFSFSHYGHQGSSPAGSAPEQVLKMDCSRELGSAHWRRGSNRPGVAPYGVERNLARIVLLVHRPKTPPRMQRQGLVRQQLTMPATADFQGAVNTVTG